MVLAMEQELCDYVSIQLPIFASSSDGKAKEWDTEAPVLTVMGNLNRAHTHVFYLYSAFLMRFKADCKSIESTGHDL